jgi:predicted methyltransferase
MVLWRVLREFIYDSLKPGQVIAFMEHKASFSKVKNTTAELYMAYADAGHAFAQASGHDMLHLCCRQTALPTLEFET